MVGARFGLLVAAALVWGESKLEYFVVVGLQVVVMVAGFAAQVALLAAVGFAAGLAGWRLHNFEKLCFGLRKLRQMQVGNYL